MPPLCSEGGIDSDHRCVYVEALFLPKRNFEWVASMRRTRGKGREAFAANLAGWDWSGLGSKVESMATRLRWLVLPL